MFWFRKPEVYVPLFAMALCGLLRAQSADAPKPAYEATFRTDARLVDLHATVQDKNGRLLLDLPESAFTVYENGVKQEVKVFRREDVPVSLGLLIDNSASMRDKRSKVASAALALVEASNPQDEVFVVNFNDEVTLEKDFTSNIQELEKALAKISSQGETAMWTALRVGLEHLKRVGKKDKKVLLVVSDGEDNRSVEPLEHLIQTAQQNGVLIYAVGLLSEDDPREAERARRALDALTQATGGESWYPQHLSEIDAIARRVAHDIRNQYFLGYSPSHPAWDGTFRRIRVVVNAPGEPVVRTRSGYYARPDGQ